MPHVIYLHSALARRTDASRNDRSGRAAAVRADRRRRRARARRARQPDDAGGRRQALPRGAALVNTIQGAHRASASSSAARRPRLRRALLASGTSSSSVGTYAGQIVMGGFVNLQILIVLRRTITMVPALIVLAVAVSPTNALVASQVVLSFGIPFALIPLVRLTGSRSVMGTHVNARATSIAAWAPLADRRPQPLPARPAALSKPGREACTRPRPATR